MKNAIKVGDYNSFVDASGTVKVLNDSITTQKETIKNSETKLSDENIFAGPTSTSCQEGFKVLQKKVQSMSDNFGLIGDYLVKVKDNYQSTDGKAVESYLNILEKLPGYGVAVSGGKIAITGNTNQDKIYNYLKAKGFNNAAICGILANIEHESGFRPTALGDSGTSFGICQWHNNRWTNLRNYCKKNNLNSETLEGQLNYLVYELENNYPGVYNTIKNVPDTKEGAYQAASKWTIDFEVPANRYQQAKNRGATAQSKYWDAYNK